MDKLIALSSAFQAPADPGALIPLVIVFTAGLALVPALLAYMKGHNPILWYLYGCVFFPGALLQAILLSNVRRRSGPAAQPSLVEELEAWARLKDRGVLTAEEFDQKKRELLARPPV